MRRTISVILAILTLLLLSGCSKIPDSLDDFFDWTERFSINGAMNSFFGELLGRVVPIISALIFIVALFGLIRSTIKESEGSLDFINDENISSAIILTLSVALLSQILPISEKAFRVLFNDNLTLDWVVDSMGWDVFMRSLNELTLVSWAFTLTLFLPLISSAFQFLIVIFYIVAIIISSLRRNGSAFVNLLVLIGGWALFPFFYYALVTFLGIIKPSGWQIINTDSGMSLLYLIGVGVLMLICYTTPVIYVCNSFWVNIRHKSERKATATSKKEQRHHFNGRFYNYQEDNNEVTSNVRGNTNSQSNPESNQDLHQAASNVDGPANTTADNSGPATTRVSDSGNIVEVTDPTYNIEDVFGTRSGIDGSTGVSDLPEGNVIEY